LYIIWSKISSIYSIRYLFDNNTNDSIGLDIPSTSSTITPSFRELLNLDDDRMITEMIEEIIAPLEVSNTDTARTLPPLLPQHTGEVEVDEIHDLENDDEDEIVLSSEGEDESVSFFQR